MKALEEEVRTREKALKDKESARKQIVLRLSPGLWADIAKWADEDFRSINGQIEYILTDAVNRRKR
ncbi:MAG: Arc family DNA-binding protein [Oscillospiraceae bacterium]|nr:Arc family DNA-binding protein [Oscillospiraceae bacterium]